MNLRNLITAIALTVVTASSALAASGPQMFFSSQQQGGNPASNNGVVRNALGVPIATSGFIAQLWGGTAGNNPNTFVFVTGAQSTFSAAQQNPVLFAGQIIEGAVEVPANFGDQFFYQVRVWDSQGGTITSYAQAVAAGTGQYGSSAVAFRILPDDSTGQPPTIANFLSFNLTAVPEPSVLALGLVGGVVLFMRRRK